MHVSPSTLSRQIQRLEEDLGQPLFVRDNRTVTLTEAGEELRVFAQQTLLQYQQLRHTIDQQGPSLSGELHIFCSVTAAYSHLPPILDRFRADTRRWRSNSPLVMRQMQWKKWSRRSGSGDCRETGDATRRCGVFDAGESGSSADCARATLPGA
ncbi:DNA-binding transcriptional regulator IlvY [Escherichia coli]|uniref:DNA-binding transcriptional regulator IlvY n=1 Tax=Escherichia coli TaxID=562 RepID=A0A377B7B2_ECOLX|nr:DNA-binding transcriptional regulator IlvY [Escherichia coli]